MQSIWSEDGRTALARYAALKVAVIFDFDGTLAPIVDQPDEAGLSTDTRALLVELTARYPCAVISGRAWEDVNRRLAGTGIEPVVGSHGADWGFAPVSAGVLAERVRRWAALLRTRFHELAGVAVEDKTYSIAVHYRRAPNRDRARTLIRSAVSTLHGARVSHGKDVFNVVPEGSPDKAVALGKLRRLLGCDVTIYVGDDTNDEPVFSTSHEGRLLGIRVGEASDTSADYFVEDQPAVDRLLRALVELRPVRLRANG